MGCPRASTSSSCRGSEGSPGRRKASRRKRRSLKNPHRPATGDCAFVGLILWGTSATCPSWRRRHVASVSHISGGNRSRRFKTGGAVMVMTWVATVSLGALILGLLLAPAFDVRLSRNAVNPLVVAGLFLALALALANAS